MMTLTEDVANEEYRRSRLNSLNAAEWLERMARARGDVVAERHWRQRAEQHRAALADGGAETEIQRLRQHVLSVVGEHMGVPEDPSVVVTTAIGIIDRARENARLREFAQKIAAFKINSHAADEAFVIYQSWGGITVGDVRRARNLLGQGESER